VLETVGVEPDAALLGRWTGRVRAARAALGWPDGAVVTRPHASGASLALAAPWDQLFTATEVAEWSLIAALAERDPHWWARVHAAALASAAETPDAPVPEPIADWPSALLRLQRLAREEARPALIALLDAAARRDLSFLLDDERLSIGLGSGGRSWQLEALPAPDAVPWAALYDVPVAVVTGSNGKTTTVRLLAACAAAHGWTTGHSSTDGLVVAGQALSSGDYSGPHGARTVLRDATVEAAVLETARGGLLRRGLAVQRADVAIVTNVTADHFGEYGVHDLATLAAVKLSVARLIGPRGRLVLNADDAECRAAAPGLGVPLAWFALDADHPLLVAHRAAGGETCGVRAGRLVLSARGAEHDLGAVSDLPLACDGGATYNVANLAAAALGGAGLGIPAVTMATVFARFGADPADNRGRLERYRLGGLEVLLDYAHNPEGLAGLLQVARHLRPDGRLGMLLGQAGNREDADIRRLGRTAAEAAPDRVVLKDLDGFLRGRRPGEVPDILRTALLEAGLDASVIELELAEAAAARRLLAWARPGDAVVLPVHSQAARTEVLSLLTRLKRLGWKAGDALP
jgi:cyanophycin synthetase